MRDRGHVTDRGDRETDGGQRAQRRLTARTGALHFDVDGLQTVVLRLLGGVFCGHLGSVGGRFPRPLEAHGARGRPRDGVALHVRDQDLGVVERGVHVNNASGDVLALFALNAGLVASHCLSLPLLLLAGDRLGRALAGTSVGVGALAANRKVLAVTQAAVAAEVHQTLDVHRHFTAQVALDREVGVDVFADGEHFGVGQIVHAAGRIDADGLDDLGGEHRADAVDVLKSDRDAFPGRNVDASNTCQSVDPFVAVP
ncbi:hypothetical protein SDC9_41995 [bioreactor metagenome]|uniref:Uncharacterized protein n=1 Tax=bioreactor metagenome TaxID=1076179 RepID=A0A644VZT7_9ZZZZ